MPRPVKKMKIGDIVRYRKGPTALLRIEKIYDYTGKVGEHFSGTHCCGGTHGAYASDCVVADERDKITWNNYKADRASCYSHYDKGYDDYDFTSKRR